MSIAKPVAVYLRVSTADQSHDSQRGEVLRWLERQGISLDRVEWYTDTWTGRELARPHFDRLRRDIAHGKLTTVCVFKLDRIGRDMLDAMKVLSEWIKAGVRIASATEPIDVTGVTGKIVAAVLLGVAEMELVRTRDRQAAGIAAAREKGVYLGRRPGSTKVPDASSRAREMRSRGLMVKEIAATLGISVRTAKRYLATVPESPPA